MIQYLDVGTGNLHAPKFNTKKWCLENDPASFWKASFQGLQVRILVLGAGKRF